MAVSGLEGLPSTKQKNNKIYQVFVYGTLKFGFANHDKMLKKERFLGSYVTIG
ncbi:MAG: gamma-glutamylcyclotransferase, partial [Gammaproteobacteria bacterium]|nr:gamma-glutamylcyclotransferase [Gammaproteobacteria bacterium]